MPRHLPCILHSAHSGTNDTGTDRVTVNDTYHKANGPTHSRANPGPYERTHRIAHKHSFCFSHGSADESTVGAAHRNTNNQYAFSVAFGRTYAFSNSTTNSGAVQWRRRHTRLQHCSVHQYPFCPTVPGKMPAVLPCTNQCSHNSVAYGHTNITPNVCTTNNCCANRCPNTIPDDDYSSMQWRE